MCRMLRECGVPAQHQRQDCRCSAGVTGLLAETDVPLLLRLSVAHRQDGLTPGVSTVNCTLT